MARLRALLLASVCLALIGCRNAPVAPDPIPNPTPNPEAVPVDFHPLVVPKGSGGTLPRGLHVYFAILAHSNGKVYVGTCYHVARLVEFDPRTGRMKVVATMTSRALHGGGPKLKNPTLLGDLGTGAFPKTRWVHAQDKIHCQLLEGPDGSVYGATHSSREDTNSTRNYPGGHWFVYDPRTGRTKDLGWARRHEGIITTCMDKARNVLYGITWPTGYLVQCKPAERDYRKRLRILGLASSRLDCSPRYFDVVKDGRVYVPDGATGDIRVYDPRTRKFRHILGLTTPSVDPPVSAADSAIFRMTGRWRNWWMTGTRSPDGMHIFLTSQRSGHLTEIDATQGRWGVVIDHGRSVPWGEREWSGPWCGLMTFGRDGLLYHTVGRQLLTYDRTTGRVLDWGQTVLRSDPGEAISLGMAGSLGPDGKIYCVARYKKRTGIAVLDPAQLKRGRARLLRVSPRRITRPVHESR